MKRILDCKLFDDCIEREYKIQTVHKIFGGNEMFAVINGFIDDEEHIGVVVHGKELYCYKNDDKYNFIEENNRVFISDGLMEISISK